ncbi:hypothetical protein [Nocardioides mangrovi]|uniref:Uncharacterized protein n=1 Tax=Nocardioides mangrovi TaxID=2874580 RepID=A0ABS7U8B3_9ACTN|nr:hypothetical protein [Nocardioides mangrovi]MBZ5737224.1 hypothetical protein [Nocardioides mangrovi]
MQLLARGIVAALTLPALAVPVLAVTTSSYAAADPAPAEDGAAWLAAHLPAGDPGLSIDVALALDEVGGYAGTVGSIRDQVAATADEETAGSAAASAHTILLAAATGDDPTDFGGVDLVARLESLSDGGRVSADSGAQAVGVQALDLADSDLLGEATADLLARQCTDGAFPSAVGAGCGDDAMATTARAVLALVGQEGTAPVDDALRDAMNWILQEQGSLDDTPTAALATRALGALGEDGAAGEAAAWVRSRQLTDVGTCNYYASDDEGAVAYSSQDDIDEGNLAAYQRSTAEALPALRWAPGRAGEPRALLPSGYVTAGAMHPFRVDGLAPGEALCLVAEAPLQRVLVSADATGGYQSVIFGPDDGESLRLSAATVDGTLASVELTGLGPKRLAVALRKKVAKGHQQTVRVSGLAAAERVTVKIAGARVGRGRATSDGTFATRFRVTGKPRTVTVVVQGEVAGRTATKTFEVLG